jgi:transcriptional regulator with XRE-family HTH domain
MAIDRYKFGENVYKILKAKGMKQKELADAMGVNKESFSRWMNGTRVPSIPMMLKMADILNVSMDRLTKGMYVEDQKRK